MAKLMPTGKQQYFDSNGNPLNGGKVYTFETGTSTPKATYSNASGTTPNENPVILNSRGEALIFWDGVYDVQVNDANDNLIYSVQSYSAQSEAVSVSYGGSSLDSILKNSVGKVVSSISDLRAADKTKYTQVCVTGYYAAGDGGGGFYYYDAADTSSADNGGTIIVATDGGRWKLTKQDSYSINQFGATPGSTAAVNAAAITAAFSALGGSDGTGYNADPKVIDLLGQELTFTGTIYVPINVSLVNGKLTSSSGKIVFRNPYLADTTLRGYTEYWPYMKSHNREVIFNCLTVVSAYIGLQFYGCAFNDQHSALVLVNSNGLWTEYTYFDDACRFASNTSIGAAVLFDGNISGTSIYSVGTGAGTSDGSFGYTTFANGCKIDSTAPAVGIKVKDGAKLYNSHIGLVGYARGAGPSGGTIYIDSSLNVSAIAHCSFNLHLESFGTASNVLSISDNSQFWYNTGNIYSASPEMVMTQGALADIRSNDISVVGVVLTGAGGSAVTNGPSYMTKLKSHVSKREWTEPTFSAYSSANQTFSSNVVSLVTLGTEEWDTNSNFASSRFTPTVAGYYQINAQGRISATATAAACDLRLYKNGAAYRQCDTGPLGASMVRSISTLVYLNGTGDYLEMYVYVFDNGGTPSVVSGVGSTYLNGCLVRKA